jgi:O-succinylbenzoic acid--CoA ligase
MNIIYKGKSYSLNNLKQHLKSTSSSNLINNSTEGFIAYPANNSLLSSLLIIDNIDNSLLLMPYNDQWTDKENKLHCLKVRKQSSHHKLAISTSGTKSQPKTILISYHNITSHCSSFNKVLPLNENSIWLNCLPLTHIAGIMIVYRCLFHQASMLLHDEFNAKKIWSDIKAFNISHISLVPIMLARLLDQSLNQLGHDTKPPDSLNYILVGGSRLSDTLYQRAIKAGWPIYMSYGMTEATSTIAIGRSPEKLKFLDGFATQLGSKGELKIKGDMVSDSYINDRKQMTKPWFSTHDIVDLYNGYVNVIGRDDDIIISGGININPQFIKELILSSDQVNHFITDIEIIKQSHPQWGETIVALVVGDKNKLEFWVKENINSLYRPRVFISVEKIPRNRLGKLNNGFNF